MANVRLSSCVWRVVAEKLITPEAFARVFCDDLDIPQSWATEVAKQITEQCDEQTGIAEIALRGEEDERDEVEKDLRVILNVSAPPCRVCHRAAAPRVGTGTDKRSARLPQLDVQIGTLHLVDRIEWDLSSPLTPELFASILVSDLALSSSAAPLIAHALHAELHRHKKNCLEMGLIIDDDPTHRAPHSGAVDHHKRERGTRALLGVWRDWAEVPAFGPRLEVLSLDEMDKVEADRERAIRSVRQLAWAMTSLCPRSSGMIADCALCFVRLVARRRRAKRDRLQNAHRTAGGRRR